MADAVGACEAKNGGGVSIDAPPLSMVSAGGARSMGTKQRRVRTVLMGNSFASRVQVPGLCWAGGAELVGIAGRDADRARASAEELGIPLGTGDWRELLALEPDLVIVSTPVDLHRPMVLASLEAGAAVLCEKPFALDSTEAREMERAAAAREGGARAWIDHELRWSPFVAEVRRRVRAGVLGEPWLATFELFAPPAQGRAKAWSWWFEADRGGGVLGALGSHMIDLLRWILGEVEAVRATLLPLTRERRDVSGQPRAVTADELALVELRHRGGMRSELRSSTVLHQERFFRLQVEGSAGCLRLDGSDALSWAEGGGPFVPVPVAGEFPTCSAMGLPEYGPFGRAFPLFARDLVAAVAAGEDLPGAATFADGVATQAVLDAARRSSAGHGGWESCP